VGFFELIEARHSVRVYRDEPVDAVQLHKLLAAAALAPSAGDLQAYQVVIVEAPAAKAALATAALGQDFLAQAPAVLVFLADPARSAAKYGQRGAALFSIQDATIAAAYVQLAATELGLATCWVGAFRDRPVADAVAAPAGLHPVALVAVGHPAESPVRPPRRSLESFCRRERF